MPSATMRVRIVVRGVGLEVYCESGEELRERGRGLSIPAEVEDVGDELRERGESSTSRFENGL